MMKIIKPGQMIPDSNRSHKERDRNIKEGNFNSTQGKREKHKEGKFQFNTPITNQGKFIAYINKYSNSCK